MKKLLAIGVSVLLLFLAFDTMSDLKQLKEDYQNLQQAFTVKTDTAFYHSLDKWDKGTLLVHSLKRLAEVQINSNNRTEVRELIDLTKELEHQWGSQLTNLIIASDSTSMGSIDKPFYRINDLWLTSNKQKELFITTFGNDWIMWKVSFLFWQSRGIDSQSRESIQQLIPLIEAIDNLVLDYQSRLKNIHFYDQKQYNSLRVKLLEDIEPLVKDMDSVAGRFKSYSGSITVINKIPKEQKIHVMYGVTKEELASTPLKELTANSKRNNFPVKVEATDLFNRIEIGDTVSFFGSTSSLPEGAVYLAKDLKIIKQ